MRQMIRTLVALGAVCSFLVFAPSLGHADCGNGIIEGGEECDGGPTLFIDGDPAKGTCTTGSRCYYQFTCCKFNCQYVGTPGVPCQDGDSCSGPDVCNQVGVCLGGPAVAENTPCDDGLFCNGAETCHNGVCGSPDGDPCPGTACNECQEATDSCFTPPGTTPCNGSVCVSGGTCDGAGTCNGGTFNAGPCDDGLYCNGTDTCDGGACSVHTGDPCPESEDGDGDCLEGCDETADSCTGADPEFATCDNGLFCDGAADECLGGACTGTGSVTCDDGNSCTVETCDELLDTCTADGSSVDGTPCDDADPCTLGDVCASGACAGGTTQMDDFCPWTVVMRENFRKDTIKTGRLTSIDGDTCGGGYKLKGSTTVTSDVVSDEELGIQLRITPDAIVGEDIVTNGSGAKAIPGSGILPYTSTSELPVNTLQAKNDLSGFYDFSGTHPLVAPCATVRESYAATAGTLNLFVATASSAGIKVPTEGSASIPVANVGGLNIIDIDGNLQVGKDAVLELSGGGSADTVVLLRINGKFGMKLRASLELVDNLTPNHVLIYVKGKQCKLGDLSLGAGTLFCSPAKLKATRVVAWVGALFGDGKKLQIGDLSQVSWNPFNGF